MFGMGFTEILIIAVIAILFLGPEKLPSAMVDIAKFFRQMKKTVGSMKDTLEEEMNVSEIKQEALEYKKQLLDVQDEVSQATSVPSVGNIGEELSSIGDDIIEDIEKPAKVDTPKEEKVTFKKKKKKNNEDDSVDV